MAQHDYVIANQSGSSFRSDLNNALSAIVSQNSGSSEPSTTYAYQTWADTTNGVMKMRNGANSAWITLYQLDGEWSTIAFENGTAAAPSIYFKDSGTDTGFYSPGANQVGISTGGTARLTIDSSGNVNIDSNTLYVDAANDRVGLGTSSPNAGLNVGLGGNGVPAAGAATGSALFSNATGGNAYGLVVGATSGGLGYIQAQRADGTATTYNLAIQPNGGSVGIGTTSPGALLHVSQAGNTETCIGGTATPILSFIGGAATDPVIGYANGALRFGTVTGNGAAGFSEKVRLDTSGRLGIGTSSPSFTLDVKAASVPTIRIDDGAAQGTRVAGKLLIGGSSTNGVSIENSVTTYNDVCSMVFSTTPAAGSITERMRIASNGGVLIGRTTNTDSATLCVDLDTISNIAMSTITSATTLKYHLMVRNGNGQVGSISTNGSATAFNTSSDYRLKENIVPVTDAIGRLNQLQVHRFNFIADPDKTVDGFIAHEAQAVVPECVTGTKDEVDADGNPVYQGIDQSKLVPLLTAALQEALAEIESLKARVTALEP